MNLIVAFGWRQKALMWIAHNWREDHIQQGLARLSCYLHVWMSPVSIILDILWVSRFPVCVCMCECRGREIERERERPSKLSRPFSLLPDQKMMTQWWFGQVKHFVFVLYSSHAKRPELRRPQKIRYYAPKSEDRRGFVK